MDNDVQEYKRYAVVKFLSDSTFSEIPTAWLVTDDDNQFCWWPPRTSNTATLIYNCTTSNFETWVQYEVDIMKYCSSLESARKSAADCNYQTTDEELLGRGKRQHIASSRYDSDEEEYDNPQSRKSKNKKKSSKSNIVLSQIPACPDNLNLSKSDTNNVQKSITSAQDVTILQHEKENDATSATQEAQYLPLDNIPIVFEECSIISNNKTSEEDFNMKESIKQVLRMQAALQITLQDILQRIIKLENAVQNRALNLPRHNDVLIAQFLPLTSTNNIKEFESLLQTTEEAVTQFKEFLAKSGGNNPKDNIQRNMKKIFTNECAIHCSWKGIRNNFRIFDLLIIKIMRREITSRYVSLTEVEFDYVAAEWLRFAKQRKERDDKANITD